MIDIEKIQEMLKNIETNESDISNKMIIENEISNIYIDKIDRNSVYYKSLKTTKTPEQIEQEMERIQKERQVYIDKLDKQWELKGWLEYLKKEKQIKEKELIQKRKEYYNNWLNNNWPDWYKAFKNRIWNNN